MSFLPKAGSTVDERYWIHSVIGAGAFGVVFRARDETNGEKVALKTLLPEATQMPDLVQRFSREARICEQLQNSHTARMLGHGELPAPSPRAQGVPYMVFELVRGLPLGRVLVQRGERFELHEVIHICIAVLESLTEAHGLGIIHRDIKPDNVMALAPEKTWGNPHDLSTLSGRLGIPPVHHGIWKDLSKLHIKVVDFGLGKILQTGNRKIAPLTRVGVAAGTAHYMSPEQVETANDIDYRSDIYAVAMLLYRLLVGSTPYEGKTAAEVALAHVAEPPVPLPEPWASQPIQNVYLQAAAKRREDRFYSADEMIWALRCVQDPSLIDQDPPDFQTPPEVLPHQRGFFARLFGRR